MPLPLPPAPTVPLLSWLWGERALYEYEFGELTSGKCPLPAFINFGSVSFVGIADTVSSVFV